MTLKEKMCSVYQDNFHWIFYLIICYVFYIFVIKPIVEDFTSSQIIDFNEIFLEDGLVYRNESDNPYTGYVKVSKDGGDTILLSYYSDGLRDDLWVEYYDQIERSKDYEDRTFDKPIKSETYTLYEKGKLVNGVINEYFEDGTLKEEINYNNGKKHGIQKKFKRDGEISGIVSFNNGELHGRCESYYSDGTLSKVENYKNDLHHGLFEWFYENGQLESFENYKNGLDHGETKGFYENGQLSFVGNFKNGKEHGEQVSYFENGQEEYIENYKEGLDHGLFKKWDNQGKLLYEYCYKDDDKVEMSFCEGEQNSE